MAVFLRFIRGPRRNERGGMLLEGGRKGTWVLGACGCGGQGYRGGTGGDSDFDQLLDARWEGIHSEMGRKSGGQKELCVKKELLSFRSARGWVGEERKIVGKICP